jgi:hypothetical protein
MIRPQIGHGVPAAAGSSCRPHGSDRGPLRTLFGFGSVATAPDSVHLVVDVGCLCAELQDAAVFAELDGLPAVFDVVGYPLAEPALDAGGCASALCVDDDEGAAQLLGCGGDPWASPWSCGGDR